MTDCRCHRPAEGRQRQSFVTCQNPACENCGWNPKCSDRCRAALREREERDGLVDRELMARSLAAFEADMDYGVIDCDAEGHPKWRKARVYR